MCSILELGVPLDICFRDKVFEVKRYLYVLMSFSVGNILWIFSGELKARVVSKNILIEGSIRLRELRYSYMSCKRNVAWFLVY